jgi:hypothetical protein
MAKRSTAVKDFRGVKKALEWGVILAAGFITLSSVVPIWR